MSSKRARLRTCARWTRGSAWKCTARSHDMRKIPVIFGLILLAVLAVWEVYEFLVTNDGVGYFTSHPRRLIYVVATAVVGGVLVLAFSRLSPIARRCFRLAALGGFGACLTVFLGVCTARLVLFAAMVTDSGMWGWVIAALVSLSVVMILVWTEFYFVWRRHETPSNRGCCGS